MVQLCDAALLQTIRQQYLVRRTNFQQYFNSIFVLSWLRLHRRTWQHGNVHAPGWVGYIDHAPRVECTVGAWASGQATQCPEWCSCSYSKLLPKVIHPYLYVFLPSSILSAIIVPLKSNSALYVSMLLILALLWKISGVVQLDWSHVLWISGSFLERHLLTWLPRHAFM